MDRLLVIGATGLVGSKVAELAPRFGYEPHYTHNLRQGPAGSHKLDITDRAETLDFVKRVRPDVMVHTAALHNVDYCETHKDEAVSVNIEGTRNLADAAIANGSKIICLSTDYVFDGTRGHYNESDIPHPLHHYAWTKLEAEKIVSQLPISVIARPSVIYGWNTLENSNVPSSSGKTMNFAMFVLDKLQKGELVKAVNDQFSSPTFADNLAEALLRLARSKATGIFHIAGRSCLSRYEFAARLAEIFGYPTDRVQPISTSELKQLAVRPKNSCLSVEKGEKLLGMRFLTVEEGLSKMKEQVRLVMGQVKG